MSNIYAEWTEIAELDLMEATDAMVEAGHRSLRPKLKHCKVENKETKSLVGPVAQVARQWIWAKQEAEYIWYFKNYISQIGFAKEACKMIMLNL